MISGKVKINFSQAIESVQESPNRHHQTIAGVAVPISSNPAIVGGGSLDKEGTQCKVLSSTAWI